MASTRDWFESVAEAERRAQRRLPRSVYGALVAGAESGLTLNANQSAFRELGFFPRIATGVPPVRDLSTRVLGQDLAYPVIISPTGVQAVHPDAEVAVARASAAAGIAMGLSSFASKPLAEVVAANPATLFQVYWMGGRERVKQLLAYARHNGVQGIIMTLDWTFAHRRDWGSPPIPTRIDVKTAFKFAPEVLARPHWLLRFARSGGLPTLTVPNMARSGAASPGFFEAYGEWMATPSPTWEDIAWVRDQWEGKLVIKGVSHPDDAIRVADIGADALSVSNHGGNNLDGSPASIRALPGIVEAVSDRLEILLDGGIRRGSDVVKALALGASAVMVGRAPLWGLAASGEAGVANVLEILRAGVDETLVGLGRSAIDQLTREDVMMPPGFPVRPKEAPTKTLVHDS
ncbi:MAG: pre-mycofactocin synthase MftD [Solirubrobacteraceae bacterium]